MMPIVPVTLDASSACTTGELLRANEMKLKHILRTAFRGISANLLRSVLTALGVMIGVASVITTLALGNGARASVDSSFRFLGSDQVQVNTKMDMSKGEFKAVGKNLTYEDGLNMLNLVPLVDHVDMNVSASTKLRSGRNVVDQAVIGTTAAAIDNMVQSSGVQPVNWQANKQLTRTDFLGEGRFFTENEVLANSYVCVLGYQTAQDLFGGMDPLGQSVWIGRKPYTVIGVLAELETVEVSQRQYSKPNETVLLPIGPVIQNFYTTPPSINLIAHVSDSARMVEAKRQISAYLRKVHSIMPDADGNYVDDFMLTTKEDLLGAQLEAARTFSTLLTAMAIVSLSVGGIGIMNVMLVSITERTREIGVRMAIGARRKDIVVQFLLEAVLLSAASGVFGIALGVFVIPLAAILNQGNALLDPNSVPLSFGVALVTGIIFGLYPALRAAQLDPIDALRYE
jgi:putative ABC transport system permease protein